VLRTADHRRFEAGDTGALRLDEQKPRALALMSLRHG